MAVRIPVPPPNLAGIVFARVGRRTVATTCASPGSGRASSTTGHDLGTFHDLRHAFASLLLAFGYTVLYVSQQLGHSCARSLLSLKIRKISRLLAHPPPPHLLGTPCHTWFSEGR